MSQYTYFKSCVDHEPGEVPALTYMVENAIEVTLATMRRNCAGLDAWAKAKGYEKDARVGLTLKNDPYVSYHRSRYENQICYFLVWSAIEFIWLPKLKFRGLRPKG